MGNIKYRIYLKQYEDFKKSSLKGLSVREIAETYGVDIQCVRYRLKVGYPKSSPLKNIDRSHLEGRDRTRMLVRIRDNFTCQDCGLIRTHSYVSEHNGKLKSLKGKIKNFDVHHTHGMCGKNSKGYDMEKDLSKMVTLCHKCHFNRPEHATKKNPDIK